MAGKKGCKRRKFPNMDALDPRFQINKRITEIGEIQEVVNSLIRGHKIRDQKQKKQLALDCAPRNIWINRLLFEIFTIAKKNRRELSNGQWKKIIQIDAGIIGWRFTPYGTTIRNVKKAIKWMGENGFGKYIRMVPEVDKQLLIRDRAKVREKIPGVFIARTEEFGVEPNLTENRVALSVKRLERLAKKTAKKNS